MRPVLFVWRGMVLRSFQVMVYAALLAALLITVHVAQADGLDPDRTAIAVLLSYIPAFAGARLLYVVRHWDFFRRDPSRIRRRSDGGLSLYGGFFGIFAGAIPILWAFGLPFAPFFDALMLGILGGLVVAKGGCFLNGCCYGQPTDHWCGVDLPDDLGVWRRRFPSQLAEMAWAAAVLALMLSLRSLSPPSGAVACAAVALQPAGRIFLQKLRDEGPAENAAVRKTCLFVSAAGLAAGLLVWLW
jgi:phosphatidylglycerol:prolipoprotein diacylglycerol transferase